MLSLVFLVLLFEPFVVVNGHARLECPPPLSGETGEKVGPCDVDSDDLSIPAYTLQANALNTITWLESLGHPGAPQRFALSIDLMPDAEDDENTEISVQQSEPTSLSLSPTDETFVTSFETCLLLDHVPHDEYSDPSLMDPLSYHRTSITLWIPDIKCNRCYLQLISIMSDEIHGVPEDTSCKYRPGGLESSDDVGEDEDISCMVVYHSCSPVKIEGSVKRNDIETCNTEEYESILNWPLTDTSELNEDGSSSIYQHSTYYYKGNPGLYDQETRILKEIGSPVANCNNFFYCDPDEFFDPIYNVSEQPYTQMEGTCAAIIPTEVIPFQPDGVLPFMVESNSSSASPSTSPSVSPSNSPSILPTLESSSKPTADTDTMDTGDDTGSSKPTADTDTMDTGDGTGDDTGDDTGAEDESGSTSKWNLAYHQFMFASVTLMISVFYL